ADIAVKAAYRRWRKVSEAIVVHAFECTIDRIIVDLLAPLRRTLYAAVRAGHGVDLGSMIVEAILHRDVDGSAERVETERRIVGDHRHGLNRGRRDQVPVDGVTEGFVDAYPVLVHREPLRRARHRGRDKAAELHIGLKGI